MSLWISIISLFCFIQTQTLFGQAGAEKTQEPASFQGSILLPLATYGINDRQERNLKDYHERFATELRQVWGLQPDLNARLSTEVRGRLNRNVKTRLSAYAAGPSPQNLILAPFSCRIGSHLVLGLSAIDAVSGDALRVDHRVIEDALQPPFSKVVLTKLDPALLRELASAPKSAIAEGAASASQNPQSRLKLGSSSSRPLSGEPKGDETCLALLALGGFANAGIRLTPLSHLLELQTLADALKLTNSGKRPNRRLVLDWQIPEGGFPKDKAIRVKARLAEAVVFGKSDGTETELQIAARVEGNRFALSGFDPLLAELQTEAKQLTAADMPKVVATDRAWAYVDRGRAWGLTMNTRLVAQDDPLLAGHVVAFFGPEAGLKDLDGRRLLEGAIIFIRKGQAKVTKGMAFTYDPAVYPRNP